MRQEEGVNQIRTHSHIASKARAEDTAEVSPAGGMESDDRHFDGVFEADFDLSFAAKFRDDWRDFPQVPLNRSDVV